MAVRMVFHGTLCQRLPLASVGSPLQVSDDVQSVGRSSVCLTGAIKNTRRHAGSVRSPSVLLRRSKGVQQLSWLKSEFNGPLPVRGLQSKANVRGFSRNSETIASSSGAVNESSSPESSHASGGDDGDRKFAWLETLVCLSHLNERVLNTHVFVSIRRGRSFPKHQASQFYCMFEPSSDSPYTRPECLRSMPQDIMACNHLEVVPKMRVRTCSRGFCRAMCFCPSKKLTMSRLCGFVQKD